MGLGLSLPSTPSPAPALPTSEPVATRIGVDGRLRPSLVPVDLESFDDYDDAAHVDGVPRLRLADPPRDAPTVIVEAVGECFEVCRLRDNGTTSAAVMYTRKELTELAARIAAALEM